MSEGNDFIGLCPVIATPFKADGDIDSDGFEKTVRSVLKANVDAVMFPGFASEYHKLSDEERRSLISRLLEIGTALQARVVVSVSDHSTEIAIENGISARELGAAAVNLLPPHFLNPHPQSVVAHIERFLAAVAPLPVILQYAPQLTGVTMATADIKQLAANHPNLSCIKVETPVPGRMIQALRSAPDRVPSMVGFGGLQLPDALRRGVAGVQPGCSFVEVYAAIWRHWHEGEEAAALDLHRNLLPYLSYWMQHVELVIAAEKAISFRRGWISSDFCRSPQWVLDEFESAMIDRFMDEFSEYLR